LLSAASKVPLAGVILIEGGTTDEDNRWLVAVAARNREVLGYITYADPLDPNLEKQLDRWRHAAKFRGVRFRLEGIHSAGFPATHQFADALRLLRERDLVAELLIEPRHMLSVAHALSKIHDVKAVIDHLAKPSFGDASGDKQRSRWEEGMRALAEAPSTFCKVSLALPAEDLTKQSATERLSDMRQVRGFMRYALNQFGASRCLWGSDWPLSSLVAGYETVLSTARAALEPLYARDEAAVFHGTAAKVYSR
jgi:L-fuconolactonase